MGVPSPRTPVKIARGNYSTLDQNKAAIEEGEICYAQDSDSLYVLESGTLVKISDITTKVNISGSTMTGHLTIDNQKGIRFSELDSNGVHYLQLTAPAAVAANVSWTLPATDGTADQILVTDGNGALSFSDSTAAGATGGGNDEVFVENDKVISTSYTITASKNAHSVGPLTINNNIVVTIPANSTWLVS